MSEARDAIRLTMQAIMIGGEAVGSGTELEVAFAGFGRSDVGLKLRGRDEDGGPTVDQEVDHLSRTPRAMAAAQALVARASGGQPLRAAHFDGDGSRLDLEVTFQANGIFLLAPGGGAVAAIVFDGRAIDFSVEGQETWALAVVAPEVASPDADAQAPVGTWAQVERFLGSHGMAMALGEPMEPTRDVALAPGPR